MRGCAAAGRILWRSNQASSFFHSRLKYLGPDSPRFTPRIPPGAVALAIQVERGSGEISGKKFEQGGALYSTNTFQSPPETNIKTATVPNAANTVIQI